MNLRFLLVSFLIISLFLETTLVTLPLVYVASLSLYIIYPDIRSIILAFAAGFILDILKVDTVGLTSIIILLSFIGLEIIKKAFELKDYRIVLLLLFAASYIYASVFSYSSSLIWYSCIYILIGLCIFYFHKKYQW